MPLVDSIHFSNYRNFTDFTMKGLHRVNLIVGDSNVGKTGLLEGLVSLWGSEEQFRALPHTFRMRQGNDTGATLENYWNWFYPERKTELEIALSSSTKDRITHEMVFGNNVNRIRPPKAGGGVQMMQASPHCINILPVGIGSYQLQTDLFNQLAQKKNGKEQLIESLKIIEPRLQSLEYLKLPNSKEAMIYADIGLEYKIPTTQFGHGFTRSMEMLSNLILSGSDIMIADEIENGIHYSAMGSVWKAILNYSVKNDVQVFATTHSRECISAVHEAMLAQENYELNVVRLQNKKGEVVAINHDKDAIETAFNLGLPLR